MMGRVATFKQAAGLLAGALWRRLMGCRGCAS
jgi:hypothetical protein